MGSRLGSGDLGRAPGVEMRDFTIATMPARFAALGDLHAGIDYAVWSIEPLLEWADRDERDRGLGDAPYPPNYRSRRASRHGCSRLV